MDSVRDMFSDCFPAGNPLTDATEEFVIWARYESPQITTLDSSGPLILLMGTNKGFYIWSIAVRSLSVMTRFKPIGVASLLYSRIGGAIITARLLPLPSEEHSDYFAHARPLIAACSEQRYILFRMVQFSLVHFNRKFNLHP